MIDVVDFTPDHLERLQAKEIHRSEVPKTVLTYAITFLRDGEPIAIFGGFTFVPRVIHVWGLISDQVRKCPIGFHRQCKSVLRFYEEKYKPRRMQIDVKTDYEEGILWAQRLGFEPEGIMRKYGPDGSDYWLMARYPWEQ